MDAVLEALVAGAVGQAIQPLVDRIARLEEAAVSNDQPATGSETAKTPPPPPPRKIWGIQARTATRELRALLLSPRLASMQELRAPCLCRARVMLLEPPGRIPALIQLLAWIRKLRPQASTSEAPDDRKRRPLVSDAVREKFEAYFRTGLEAKVKGQLLQKHPRPRTLAAITPRVDPLVKRQIPQKDLRRIDGPLFEAQGLLLDAAGPFTVLWDDVQAELEISEAMRPSELVVPADRLLSCVVAGMRLLGAANHRKSAMRRPRFLAELD